MKHDYESMTFSQAIWLGCIRGFKNYFALGHVLLKCLRHRRNPR